MNNSTQVFLSLQATYGIVSLALFVGDRLIESASYQGVRASSHLIHHIDSFLRALGYKLEDCAALFVDHGPGAFVSLRVALATVNGIGFATGKPLVGVSGLAALAQMTRKKNGQNAAPVCSLLNAYNNELYVGLYLPDGTAAESVIAIKNLPEYLKNYTGTILNGNGVVLAKDVLDAAGVVYKLPSVVAHVADAAAVGELGYELFCAKPEVFKNRLDAYYLKNAYFAIAKPPI